MTTLSDALREFFERFGRPSGFKPMDEHDIDVDDRLTDLERKHRDMAIRLRILEKQGNPRGIGRDA